MPDANIPATTRVTRGLLQGPRPRRLLRNRTKRRLISAALLAFLAPHAYVVATGQELYPLTCAGMFACHVTPDTPRYVFRLTAEPADGGDPATMQFADAGANPRNFFNYVYGSASANTTHTHFKGDTPERFAQRLSAWFAGYLSTWRRMHPGEEAPAAITLWLAPIYPDAGQPTPVMRFDAATGEAELHPGVVWPADPPHTEQQGGGA